MDSCSMLMIRSMKNLSYVRRPRRIRRTSLQFYLKTTKARERQIMRILLMPSAKRYRSIGRIHDIWTDYPAVGRTEEYQASVFKRMGAYLTITIKLIGSVIAFVYFGNHGFSKYKIIIYTY